MEKISKDELKNLAKSLYFELDDHQIQELQNEFTYLFANFEKINKLDIKDLMPSKWEVINLEDALREDEAINTDADQTIKNASNKNGKYIEVK